MAHNIGEMFYYGKRPWHNLGVELAKPANIEEALKSGGLDWEVEYEGHSRASHPCRRTQLVGSAQQRHSMG